MNFVSQYITLIKRNQAFFVFKQNDNSKRVKWKAV